MENIATVKSHVKNLSNQIDIIEANIDTLLLNSDSTTFNDKLMKLSLIDQAKCNSSIAYALDSLLFAYLKSVGQDTKDHAIMQELSRVKSYMGKIKSAEGRGQGPTTVVDKEAAARVVKHALSGNARIDAENMEKTRQQQDNAAKFLQSMAERSLPEVGSHKRFSDDEDEEEEDKQKKIKGNKKTGKEKKRKTAEK